MGQFRNWVVAAAFVALATPSHAGSLSGTYVGTGPDMAVILQLVDTGSGQLTGRYEQVRLITGPKIERFNAAVKGNVDGETIVLGLKPPELPSGGLIVSGTVAPNVLHLTGGGYGTTLTLNLSKASEEDFNSKVAALTHQEGQINTTRTIAADSKQLSDILQGMKKLNVNADADIAKLKPVEDKLRFQTQTMQAALVREQSAYPREATVALRSRLNGAIYGANGESFQFHDKLQSAHTEVANKVAAFLKAADALAKKCQSPITIDTNSDTARSWTASCSELPSITSSFKPQASRLLTSFAHLEAVWQEEEQKQREIMKLSDVAAR